MKRFIKGTTNKRNEEVKVSSNGSNSIVFRNYNVFFTYDGEENFNLVINKDLHSEIFTANDFEGKNSDDYERKFLIINDEIVDIYVTIEQEFIAKDEKIKRGDVIITLRIFS